MSKPWEVKYETGSDQEAAGHDAEANKSGEASEKDPLIPKLPDDHFFSFYTFFVELHQTFGHRLLVLCCASQHLVKGFAHDWAGTAVPYMFKAYSVPAPRANVYGGVIGLPWAMKPIIGIVSDVFPVFGYNKAPYIAITTLIAIIALTCLGSLPATMLPVGYAVACLTAFNLSTSTADLLVEAKYSESIKANPMHGPNLLTFAWGGMTIASMLALAFSGIILEHFSYQLVFCIAIVPFAFLMYPILLGYLGEEYVTEEKLTKVRACFYEQGETCFLVLVMFCATVILGCTGMFMEIRANAIVTVAVGLAVLAAFSVTLSPTIAKFNAFALTQTAFGVSVGGASFYFFTDTPEQYPATATSPGGPHFSKFFYNTVMGMATAVFSLLGVWTYKRWLSTWRYRPLFLFTNVMISILSLLDLIIFSRLNVKLGIPDELFIVGASAAESIVGMWQWMPQVVILSYMVPEGMEATLYALLAGCHNLGNTISSNCGALLLNHLNITPSGAVGESAKFDNLWVASGISTLLPLIFICSFYWLIPDMSQTDRLTHHETDSATTGSLWRQWRGITD